MLDLRIGYAEEATPRVDQAIAGDREAFGERIAHNLYINGRRLQRYNSLIHDNQDDKRESPELCCEARARAEEVMQAVRALGEDQRQVLILRFMVRTGLRRYGSHPGEERGGGESSSVPCLARSTAEAGGW